MHPPAPPPFRLRGLQTAIGRTLRSSSTRRSDRGTTRELCYTTVSYLGSACVRNHPIFSRPREGCWGWRGCCACEPSNTYTCICHRTDRQQSLDGKERTECLSILPRNSNMPEFQPVRLQRHSWFLRRTQRQRSARPTRRTHPLNLPGGSTRSRRKGRWTRTETRTGCSDKRTEGVRRGSRNGNGDMKSRNKEKANSSATKAFRTDCANCKIRSYFLYMTSPKRVPLVM